MSPSRPLYFTVWRWHFYAGLFSIPFLLLLSATGATYLFRVEFEQWKYRDLLQVPASPAEQLPHEQVADAVRTAFPDTEINSYVPAFGPRESAKIQIGGGHDHSGEDRAQEVFVNPYTGELLGAQVVDDRFMERVKRLHGRLLAGTAGTVLVELASGWMFVLLVSGFYLWFPRVNWSVWGTLLPRLNSGRRTLFRDLHAVGAVYLALGLGFQILSGQPWTVFSSKAIVEFADSTPGGPNVVSADRFQSQPVAAPAGSAQDWLSGLDVTNAGHIHSAMLPAGEGSDRLSLDEVATIAEARHIMHPYQIAMPAGPAGVYSVRTISGNPRDTVYLHLDQYTGEVLASIPFIDLKPQAQAVTIGIALHEGMMFGWPNQLLALAAALGSFFIAGTGAALWWSRRPKGKLGTPAVRTSAAIPQGVVWITVVLGIVFPLVGASMLLLWGVERWLKPRNAIAQQA